MGRKITKEAITTNYKNSGLSLKFKDELDLKLKQYTYLNENKPNIKNYIIGLIEKDLKGLTLDNTFIKLDKEYTFNRNVLKDNKKAIATTKPMLEKEDAIIITEVPNNLDEYDKEQRSYCYNGDKSVHAGYYIFNDIHYFFIYDSKEETIEVKIVDPANMKYYVHDVELKEKLENDNSFVMDSLGNGLSIIDLHKTTSKPIMYRYINYFEMSKFDYGEPINPGLIFKFFFEL